LSDVRVVEVAGASGAFCGKLLADMGADVVKIEPPGGDRARAIGPFLGGRPDPNRSLFFWHYNAGKRSVVLDLDSARGHERFESLLETADVLLLGGRPSVLRRRGLELAALRARRPALVVTAISPFGQSGPRREWKGSDIVAQAAGGMLWVNGHPDEPPLRAYGLQAYHCAALHAAIGTMLALLDRERTGLGQLVDVSVQESVVAALEHAGASFHATGRVESRNGTLHWAGGFRVCRCRDGLVCCSSVGDWTALVEWLKADGEAEELARPEWEDLQYRLDHAGRLFDVVERWTRERTVAELIEGARLRRLPFAPVCSPDDLPCHPQLRARGFFVEVEHDETGPIEYPGAPYRFSRTPWRLARRPPHLGEHTAEVSSASPFGKGGSRGICPTDAISKSPLTPLFQRGGPSRNPRVLDGVRILDLTWVVAGPAATRILADHGAEVIKVERPDALSMANRRAGLTGNLNRGKRSIVLDLARSRGLALLRDLIRRADVVIDNFAPRVLRNWKLDDEALRQLNPDLIAVHMSAFGNGGPLGDHVAYGPTLQAIAGHTARMRHPGGKPAGWGYSFSDMASASYAALAVLLALRHRRRTGESQAVDLSQLEALVSLNGPDLLAASLGVPYEPALGNRSAERPAAPHGVYRCRDRDGRERWCSFCVFDDDEWRGLVGVLGDPPWAASAELRDAAARLERGPDLDARLASWTATRDADETVEALQGAGVPAAVVADAEDLCLHDPQLIARDYWTRVPTPEGGVVTLDGVLPRLSETPGSIASSAPLAGEHTDEILHDLLGLTPTDIGGLRRDRIVA
jgi:crotonobetainyl-CoA:carnitine CoA-transferase CaiB-like acyl-CoA transferase